MKTCRATKATHYEHCNPRVALIGDFLSIPEAMDAIVKEAGTSRLLFIKEKWAIILQIDNDIYTITY